MKEDERSSESFVFGGKRPSLATDAKKLDASKFAMTWVEGGNWEKWREGYFLTVTTSVKTSLL